MPAGVQEQARTPQGSVADEELLRQRGVQGAEMAHDAARAAQAVGDPRNQPSMGRGSQASSATFVK